MKYIIRDTRIEITKLFPVFFFGQFEEISNECFPCHHVPAPIRTPYIWQFEELCQFQVSDSQYTRTYRYRQKCPRKGQTFRCRQSVHPEGFPLKVTTPAANQCRHDEWLPSNPSVIQPLQEAMLRCKLKVRDLTFLLVF